MLTLFRKRARAIDAPVNLVEQFRAEHARIETGLVAAEVVSADAVKFLAQLASMRAEVLLHFTRKDALYPALLEQCAKVADTPGAHLIRIFESNMRVQSAAVKRFFEGLESSPPAQRASSFRTVATVIRQRFSTEESAVFPIYQRTFKGEKTA